MYFLDYQNNLIKGWKAAISKLSSYGKPQNDFIYSCISEFEQSRKYKYFRTAEKYYKNNSELRDKKRTFIDRKGVVREDDKLTNSKIFNPFFKKLVNQKVNFLLSEEPTFSSQNETLNDDFSKYLDKDFIRLLKNLGKEAIIKGISWLQVYYDEDSRLKFKRIPANEVIPIWNDNDHTKLDALIRFYIIDIYNIKGSVKSIRKVEYYTPEGVWYYIEDEKGLKPDDTISNNFEGHFKLSNGETVENANWINIPFIPFKYNSDEVSLLVYIKSLIDDYEKNLSCASDILQDNPNKIKVIRGYQGTDKGQFSQNLATYRTIFVANDGDATTIDNKIDVEALNSHLDRIRKNLYEAGSGVDTQELNMGNASGTALRFRYTDLESDSLELANEFVYSLNILFWFIKADLFLKENKDYFKDEVDVVFNTSMIVNESEIINAVRNSIGVISKKTAVANHPWVKNMNEELKEIDKEAKEAAEEFDSSYNKLLASAPTTKGSETEVTPIVKKNGQ